MLPVDVGQGDKRLSCFTLHHHHLQFLIFSQWTGGVLGERGGRGQRRRPLAPNCLGPRVAQSLPSGGATLLLMFSLLKMSRCSTSDTVPDLDTPFSRLTWLLCCSPEVVGGRDGHGPALDPYLSGILFVDDSTVEWLCTIGETRPFLIT